MRRRARRPAMLAAASCCGALALLGLVGGGAAARPGARGPATTGAGGTAAPRASADGGQAQVAWGHELFLSSCASCHGTDAQGIRGRAPSLHGVGALAADFYLQTGRMPLAASRLQPMRNRPAFPERQIRALVAYVASFGGPAIPTVHPRRGSLSRGQQLFALNCAGCHTIQGRGGILTGGAIAPDLESTDPRQVAQAIRIGPYAMPRFNSGYISNRDVDSIARYVQSMQHPYNRGGWSIGRIGPIPEGMVTWLLGAAALVLFIRLLGERAPELGPGPEGGEGREER